MSGMPVSQESLTLYSGGQSQQVAITGASAASTAITGSKTVYLCSTVDCFVRQGVTPVALIGGVDQFLPSYTPFRYAGLTPGNKIAVIGTGTNGTLYITPEL
jgi:hypothetical protein